MQTSLFIKPSHPIWLNCKNANTFFSKSKITISTKLEYFQTRETMSICLYVVVLLFIIPPTLPALVSNHEFISEVMLYSYFYEYFRSIRIITKYSNYKYIQDCKGCTPWPPEGFLPLSSSLLLLIFTGHQVD